MTSVTLKKKTPMKRTGLYMDAAFHKSIEDWSSENGVSLNQAVIYLVKLGKETLESAK